MEYTTSSLGSDTDADWDAAERVASINPVRYTGHEATAEITDLAAVLA